MSTHYPKGENENKKIMNNPLVDQLLYSEVARHEKYDGIKNWFRMRVFLNSPFLVVLTERYLAVVRHGKQDLQIENWTNIL